MNNAWQTIYHLSSAMVTVRGVESGDGDGLIGALAVEDAVAARTYGSQRFRGDCFEPRLRALRLQNDRSLAVVPRTPLITAGTQATGADDVVRDAGLPSRQTARQRCVLVLQRNRSRK